VKFTEISWKRRETSLWRKGLYGILHFYGGPGKKVCPVQAKELALDESK
jgi:hypothetical protein